MRDWKVPFKPGYRLNLAADARFCTPDICNDQIWELLCDQNDNNLITIQTTYGLRVKRIRFFPRFIKQENRISNPESFAGPLLLRKFAPNYAFLSCIPFPGIEVLLEYWIPESNGLTGRVSFINRTSEPENITFEWAGLLNPLGEGQSMLVYSLGPGHVLTGRAGKLSPVCYLTGSPSPSHTTIPSLSVPIELEAGQTRRLTWAVADMSNQEQSFDLARRFTTRQWDAEISRLEMQNTRQTVEIITGDLDWDLAFALSQKEAFGLYHRTLAHFPAIVNSRTPDLGYSARGDGQDCNLGWSTITPLELNYWLNLILPGAPEVGNSVLEYILQSIQEDGFADQFLGAGRQRSQMLAQPLLVNCCWQVEQASASYKLREKYFPELLRFIHCWFSSAHDHDQDGTPEWDHPQQTGVETSPIMDKAFSHSREYSLHHIESPSLAAMLYRECMLLYATAQKRKDEINAAWLLEKINQMNSSFEKFYDLQTCRPQYIDYQTHRCAAGQRLGAITGNGTISCDRQLPEPGRPLVFICAAENSRRQIKITINGKSEKKKPATETLTANAFIWLKDQGLAVSSKVFQIVDNILVKGAGENDRIQVNTQDFRAEDISLYLPLWAELMPDPLADIMIEKQIMPRYLREFGIPLTTPDTLLPDGVSDLICDLPWILPIVQGLLAYHHQMEAAEILTRIMSAFVLQIKQSLQTGEYFDTETGLAGGKMNALNGLAPAGLFLNVVGIQKFENGRVELVGENPFPWPITVKYKGMTITRKKEESTITFPSGETITVHGSGPHQISL